jgi:hypothetical protein
MKYHYETHFKDIKSLQTTVAANVNLAEGHFLFEELTLNKGKK